MTRRHAVVLGGNLAGMLAASVLADQVDEVTIVERDRLPGGPVLRNGVPQAHHGHLLLSDGVRSLESLLPGMTERLLAHGAVRLGLPNEVLVLSGRGWGARVPERHFAVSCGRSLLDWVVRDRVLGDGRIHLVEAADAEDLCGDPDRVTGAHVRGRGNGERRRFDADIVVDATGMTSRAPEWLVRLGLPPVREEVIDPGTTYSTRLYLAPPGVRGGFPAVFVRPVPGTGQPGRAGTLLPIERGQWLVSLSGTRGAEPPTDTAGFERYARSLPDGVIADLIAGAEPMGWVRGYRKTANRRRRFERVPDGFVAVGDAATAINPAYGQGMSLTADAAIALRDGLARHGFGRGSGARIQRDVLRTTRDAWNSATHQDFSYPDALGDRSAGARLRGRLRDRRERLAGGEAEVLAALLTGRASSSASRPHSSPLPGGSAAPASDPPFTGAELASLQVRGRRPA